MSPSSLLLDSEAELVSEADFAKESSFAELKSRTKCTGICQSESSANGFLPSKASAVLDRSAARELCIGLLSSPERNLTNEGEPLETEAADARELVELLGAFVVAACLLVDV